MSCKIDELTETAQHRSSYGASARFTETDPDTGVVSDVIPTSVTWTLTDGAGSVVNSRDAVPITPAASFVTAPLIDDDLDTIVNGNIRIVQFDAVYSSLIYGSTATIQRQAKIKIDCYVPKK
jgi:hypothetical protein